MGPRDTEALNSLSADFCTQKVLKQTGGPKLGATFAWLRPANHRDTVNQSPVSPQRSKEQLSDNSLVQHVELETDEKVSINNQELGCGQTLQTGVSQYISGLGAGKVMKLRRWSSNNAC